MSKDKLHWLKAAIKVEPYWNYIDSYVKIVI